MSDVKRKWCAMLAKLTSPMNPEDAARGFVNMLPMFPQQDSAYNRDTLELAARRDQGDPAIPNFDSISRAFAKCFRDNRPIEQRMGGNPSVLGITCCLPDLPTPSDEEIEHVQQAADAFKAEVAAKERDHVREKVTSAYLHGIQLAIARRDANIPLSPELQSLLVQHNART